MTKVRDRCAKEQQAALRLAQACAVCFYTKIQNKYISCQSCTGRARKRDMPISRGREVLGCLLRLWAQHAPQGIERIGRLHGLFSLGTCV